MRWQIFQHPLSLRLAVLLPMLSGLLTAHPDCSPQVYTLPVVVHVVHTGGAVGSSDNPSDSLIQAMIGVLNASWRKTGPGTGGVDMEMQFALATNDPACQPTNGINRIDGTVYSEYLGGGITYTAVPGSVDELLIKGLSLWPNTDYINIWIVNKIDGNAISPGGYAYFPQFNNALLDGVVVQASVVNGTNKTIVHEMGHAFYLYHPYEGSVGMTCAIDTNCLINGDRICDTEPMVFVFDCSEMTNVCSGESFEIVDPGLGYTVLNNYMGFTSCQFMFTAGQKIRVQDALADFRPGLLSSGALSSGISAPVAACEPTAAHGLSPFYGIQLFEFGELSVYSNTSEADAGYYIDRTCNQQVKVTAGDSVLARVTGSYLNWQQISAYIDFNGDGDFDLPDEQILQDEGGVVEDSIGIPLTGLMFDTPLRLRIVTELPGAPPPDPCSLTGNMANGVGQVEDYTVVVMSQRGLVMWHRAAGQIL